MSSSLPPKPRLLLLGTALVVCLGEIGWKGSKLLSDPSVFPSDDFVEYWAAGSLKDRPPGCSRRLQY